MGKFMFLEGISKYKWGITQSLEKGKPASVRMASQNSGHRSGRKKLKF
jgi:hypothetical protein